MFASRMPPKKSYDFVSNFEQQDLLEFIEMRRLFEGAIYILCVLLAGAFKRGQCLIEKMR